MKRPIDTCPQCGKRARWRVLPADIDLRDKRWFEQFCQCSTEEKGAGDGKA